MRMREADVEAVVDIAFTRIRFQRQSPASIEVRCLCQEALEAAARRVLNCYSRHPA